jgi:hypothetical protein
MSDTPAAPTTPDAERFGMWATDSPEVFALAKALDAVNGPSPDGEEPFPSWQRDWADQVQEELKALGYVVARSTPSEALPQKSIEQLAAEKGVGPIKSADDLRIHGITDEEADAFVAAMDSTPAEALDVERLALVLVKRGPHDIIEDWQRGEGPNATDVAELIAAEYARLSPHNREADR